MHFEKVTFRSRKEIAFLHIVKKLLITTLGLAPLRDVTQNMNGLQTIIQRTVNTRGRQQIKTIKRWMMEVFMVCALHAERTRLHANIAALGQQFTHVDADE